MSRRLIPLLLILMLMVLSAGAAQAQAPFVNITSPANNTTITNLGSVLNVTVNFGNAPEGGAGLLLRAWDDGESQMFAQNATNDVSLIPWQTTLDFTATPPTAGTHGHLTAYMLDASANIIATSAPIQVTYGSPAPPTPVPTNTPLPSPTPTNPPPPTPTPIPSSTQISISVPANGATVDPSTAISVSGTGGGLTNTTVTVRLFNANNQELGEQSAVPLSDTTWALTVTQTQNVPTTGNGSLIAYAISGNTVVAVSNPVAVNFPGAPQPTPTSPATPTVHISQPNNGSVIDISHPVHVSGTSHNLPIHKVTVRAARSDSSVIIDATVNTFGNGNWSANLPVSVPPATPGIIYVFALDSGNNIVAQDSINVTWGAVNVNPVITITSPQQGQIVGFNNAPIPVFGFEANAFENTVGVRALDTFGNTLAQTSAVAAPNGNWQAYLNVNVTPGTPGSLLAFISSPQNGAIIASARVNVIYGGQCFIRTDWPIYVVQAGDTLLKIAQRTGSTVAALATANCISNANIVYTGQQLHVPNLPVTPAPQNVTINILTPANNTQVNSALPITVAGNGLNIAGNDVVVRALDSTGNLLAQQTTTAGAGDATGNSAWQVSLMVNTPTTTTGTIYVFAQSPTTGAVIADALTNVTFGGSAQAAPTQTPTEKKLIISQPTDGISVPAVGPLQVTGQVIGPFDGDVYVRILDSQGNVIGETEANTSQPDAQGNSLWVASLTVNLPQGTRGTIFAYIPSPFDTSALISDAVNIVFGAATNGPFITLTNPMPYATLDISQPLTITGTGGALPNGALVVRALDSQGNILAEAPTTIANGGNTWQATLQVNVAVGTRGSIVAFATQGQNTTPLAIASAFVTFGDPSSTANFVRINAPLPDSLIDPSQTLMIGGTADMRNGNTVKVQIVDDQGNVLVSQPRNLSPAINGNFGVWQMLVELKSMAPGTHLHIVAMTTSKVDGSTLATDNVDIIVGNASQPTS